MGWNVIHRRGHTELRISSSSSNLMKARREQLLSLNLAWQQRQPRTGEARAGNSCVMAPPDSSLCAASSLCKANITCHKATERDELHLITLRTRSDLHLRQGLVESSKRRGRRSRGRIFCLARRRCGDIRRHLAPWRCPLGLTERLAPLSAAQAWPAGLTARHPRKSHKRRSGTSALRGAQPQAPPPDTRRSGRPAAPEVEQL